MNLTGPHGSNQRYILLLSNRSLSRCGLGVNSMDQSFDKGLESSRRSFLKGITALPLLSILSSENCRDSSAATVVAQSGTPALKHGKRVIGIQVGARSFVDEGVEGVLDTFQQAAGVNIVMPAVFTYGRGLAGRQIPGQPLPDHGIHAYDEI